MKVYGLGTYTPTPIKENFINFFTVTIRGSAKNLFDIKLNEEARKRGDTFETIFSELPNNNFSIGIKRTIKPKPKPELSNKIKLHANIMNNTIKNTMKKMSFNSLTKTSILSGSVGTSAAVKRAWQRRSKFSKGCGCLYNFSKACPFPGNRNPFPPYHRRRT